MTEFNREKWIEEQFSVLKESLTFIAETNLPPKKIDKAMEEIGLPDLVNYRSRDTQDNAGEELAEDFRRALKELNISPAQKKKVAKYLLFRVGSSKEDGWNETRDFMKGFL